MLTVDGSVRVGWGSVPDDTVRTNFAGMLEIPKFAKRIGNLLYIAIICVNSFTT